MTSDVNISVLVGKTLTAIEDSEDAIYFICNDGTKFSMQHIQDCCESVYIDDIAGDLKDLIGSPILKAEEVYSDELGKDNADSYTWTFYHLATINGYVTIKWYGESNGYYSEGVDFQQI